VKSVFRSVVTYWEDCFVPKITLGEFFERSVTTGSALFLKIFWWRTLYLCEEDKFRSNFCTSSGIHHSLSFIPDPRSNIWNTEPNSRYPQFKSEIWCSKVVLVMWLSMIFIVVQIFTATLSSWLTLNQLHPKLPSHCHDNVGYQDGSFVKEFINQDNINCFGNPMPLKTIEEYKYALSNGSITAVVDELPYIELFLAKYGSEYMKLGPINRESGIAFVSLSLSPSPRPILDKYCMYISPSFSPFLRSLLGKKIV